MLLGENTASSFCTFNPHTSYYQAKYKMWSSVCHTRVALTNVVVGDVMEGQQCLSRLGARNVQGSAWESLSSYRILCLNTEWLSTSSWNFYPCSKRQHQRDCFNTITATCAWMNDSNVWSTLEALTYWLAARYGFGTSGCRGLAVQSWWAGRRLSLLSNMGDVWLKGMTHSSAVQRGRIRRKNLHAGLFCDRWLILLIQGGNIKYISASGKWKYFYENVQISGYVRHGLEKNILREEHLNFFE